MKFIRNLELSEIIGQLLTVKHYLTDWKKTEEKKVTNIVFMGMGEPLFNYKNVLDSINVMTDEKGLALSKRKVTLSTSGVVPKIKTFKDDSDVNLAISLHAVDDKLRLHARAFGTCTSSPAHIVRAVWKYTNAGQAFASRETAWLRWLGPAASPPSPFQKVGKRGAQKPLRGKATKRSPE